MMRRKTTAKKPDAATLTLKIIGIAAIAIAVLLLAWLGWTLVQERDAIETQQDLQDLFDKSASAIPSFFLPTAHAKELDDAEGESAAEERKISERLQELHDINFDLIGWLEVGDQISTPVVYRDNKFYLEHDFYGNESINGTVFADVKNANWETDPYVVLYGHNMRNGSMFGTLDDFQSLEHLIENTRVEFYSLYDDEVLQYVPFAVVDASMEKDHYAYLKLRNFAAFQDPEDMTAAEAFIAELIDRSLFEIPGVEATIDDRILALTTCSYKLPNARLTVFCRLLREGEDFEELQEHIRLNAKMK